MPKSQRAPERRAERTAGTTESGWKRFLTPFFLALGSGLLVWAAFPPLNAWPLAWIAPLGWLHLVRRSQLPSSKPYRWIWLAGFLHWLLLLQGIRLAHPALYLGWLALAAYLACYCVLFVSLARVAVQRARVPVEVAAPVIWTGLEWARGHALTGFSMALLGHTQVTWTAAIQIADVFGAYGVSFLIVFVAACASRLAWPDARLSAETVRAGTRRSARVSDPAEAADRRSPAIAETCGRPGGSVGRPATAPAVDHFLRAALRPLVLLVAVFGLVLAYGSLRLRESSPAEAHRPPLRVVLLQGDFDTVFDPDPERQVEAFLRYRERSLEALERYGDLDLIVWPESAFSVGMGEVLLGREIESPPESPLSAAEYRERAHYWAAFFQARLQETARLVSPPRADGRPGRPTRLLVGTETQRIGRGEPLRYNTALLIGPEGRIEGRYHKTHLVMFGEYLPFGDTFPWLYRLTPMTVGLTPGERPEVFEVAGFRLAPSICFESTVPHLIRRQLAALDRAGQAPDLLVNVTNDGWFWGSSILDYHFACTVFRAVEHRRPMLVAANTGLSTYVDSYGRVLAKGPRRQQDTLFCEVPTGRRSGWYQQLGDLPACGCLLCCGGMALVGLRARRRSAKAAERLE